MKLMNKEVEKWLSIALSEQYEHNHNRAFVALYDAIKCLNESAVHKSESPKPDPRVFRHDFTPEELARHDFTHEELEQRERPCIKFLSLEDLKRQLDRALSGGSSVKPVRLPETASGALFLVGDFEIRRRK